MNDDWKPSHYRPRGGWRRGAAGLGAILLALVGAGTLAAQWIAIQGWDRDLSFTAMKAIAFVVACGCVAPHLLSGKAPSKPGQFPIERNDERVRAVDDRTP